MLTSEDMGKVQLRIQAHEGFRPHPYHDTKGQLTIGYGRNLASTGIDLDEAIYLLRKDIRHAIIELEKYPWFDALNPPRQAGLIDMMVNLGATKFGEFHGMISALRAGQYESAAQEMRESNWAQEVGIRAVHDYIMVETGEWSKSA
jgi:lysozyme